MGFSAEVLADSYSPEGIRLLTFEVSYPRIIHAEMLRHRVLSRCAASSRAIPVQRFIEQVMTDPYIPSEWGSNRPGMQAGEDLDAVVSATCEKEWLHARDAMVDQAMKLLELGVHKQLTNRLLEPFQWMTEVVTGTEWSNFFHLRIHPDAHPDIQRIARAMVVASKGSKRRPVDLKYGEWHLPFITDEDLFAFSDTDPAALPLREIPLASIGRCARTTYLKHSDTSDLAKDIARSETMRGHGHMSPFEHAARPLEPEDPALVSTVDGSRWSGNFRGWMSYRKTIPGEADMLAPAA